MGRHRRTVIVLGLVASAIFLYLAVRRLDMGSLRSILAETRVFPWLPIAIACYLAGHIIRGFRCRRLVRRESNLRLLTASNIVVVGYAANNVFPARLGELVRAGMLAERTGIPIAQSLMVTFIERVLDGLAILLLLVIGVSQGTSPGWMHDLVRVALLVFGGASGVLLLATYSPGLVVTVASRIGNKLGTKWHDRVVGLASSITSAGACLRDPRDAIAILSYSVLVWVCETGLFLAALPAFGLAPSFTSAAVAMSVTNLGLLVPSSPGFVGPFHFFCSQALIAHGIPAATALAYAAVVHLAFYIPVTIWGAISMLWYGVEVGATAAMTRQARSADKRLDMKGLQLNEITALPPATPAPLPDSAFVHAIVEAIVVFPGHQIDPKALTESSRFVAEQLAALPPILRVLLECGLAFFRFVTRLRYLRGFCDLSLEKRTAWTLAWAESRYGLFRKLLKPVRATALLAYFDHPAVRAVVTERRVAAADLTRRRDDAEGNAADVHQAEPAK